MVRVCVGTVSCALLLYLPCSCLCAGSMGSFECGLGLGDHPQERALAVLVLPSSAQWVCQSQRREALDGGH